MEVRADGAVDLGAAEREREAKRAKLRRKSARAQARLANPGFVAKAPRAVVAGGARQARRPEPGCCEGRAAAAVLVSMGEIAVRVQEAERRLLALELFGMRFGLDRMRRLMTAMGHPERAFESIHVVGTNGKSSTTRMIAAILSAHGLRAGSYLSPHLVSFCERIRIGEHDLEPAAFAAAVERALRAAALVDRNADPDDHVTQFEVLTAAAYSELAREGVAVAAIEAGLGGRFDATNVIPSKVQVLTSVGLEHTRWLGPTVESIAREKLDVVQSGATLVLGHGLHPDAVAVAEEVAAARDARIVRASDDPGAPLGALGAFQRRNFAAARAAAGAYLEALSDEAVARAAAEVRIPGRLQVLTAEPLTLLDGAHNPDGYRGARRIAARDPRSRAHARRGRLDPRRQGCTCDAGELVPLCDALVLTTSQNPRALPPPTFSHWPANSVRHGPKRCVIRASRSPVRASSPARVGWSWPPGRSIWWPISSARRPGPALGARRCCERSGERSRRQSTELPGDGGARRRQRRDRHPGVLRDRVRIRPGVPVTPVSEHAMIPLLRTSDRTTTLARRCSSIASFLGIKNSTFTSWSTLWCCSSS